MSREAKVESKFDRSVTRVESKFKRGVTDIRAKLNRSSSEIVFAKFTSKWKHIFHAYRRYGHVSPIRSNGSAKMYAIKPSFQGMFAICANFHYPNSLYVDCTFQKTIFGTKHFRFLTGTVGLDLFHDKYSKAAVKRNITMKQYFQSG